MHRKTSSTSSHGSSPFTENPSAFVELLQERGFKKVGGSRWPLWLSDLRRDLFIVVHRDGLLFAGNEQSEILLAELLESEASE